MFSRSYYCGFNIKLKKVQRKDSNTKIFDVPNLRFPEFKEEWEETILANECVINPKASALENEFVYIDLESVIKGVLTKINLVSKLDAPSRAQRVLLDKDILFQCVRPYQLNNYIYHKQDDKQWVASTGYAQIRTNHNIYFIYQLLNTPQFNQKVMLRCTGTSYPAISSTDLGNISISICSDKEQKKIGDLLTLIDQRIEAQNKIIEKYESLIKGIRNFIFSTIQEEDVYLSEIADIYQPQTISSNELLNNGEYLVYGANGTIGKYHSYNHELAQICITCRGSSCGAINYTLPKSWITGNAMVINVDNYASIIDKRYLYHYLSSIDYSNIISGSGQPQIVRSPLLQQKVLLPKIATQNQLATSLDAFLYKADIEQEVLFQYLQQKQYLLAQMFI